MTQNLTDSRLANIGASAIRNGMDDYKTEFQAITRRARQRFEARDWRGLQADASERLELRKKIIDRVLGEIRELLGERLTDKWLWAGMKAVYSGLISARDDWEIAETFYNSITRRIFTTVGVDEHIEFVDSDFDHPPTAARQSIFHSYPPASSTLALVERIIREYPFDVPYRDLKGDVQLVAERVEARLRAVGAPLAVTRAQMIIPVFYRGQRAYMIGKLFSGAHTFPFVVSLRNSPEGIVVDAVLLDEDELSILFSFTRSYFMVEIDRPYDLTRFLHSLMPRKRLAELYTSVGYHKHGKTELYRDLLHHLSQTDDEFEVAPGERGMVMLVFTLPSYDAVFKIIRDRFDDPKTTTREEVMAKYNLVFRHDRAGRLIDAQEFEHIEFDRRRFCDDLIRELLTYARNSVGIDNEHVVIKHLYVERRLTPLNIYMREADPNRVEAAVIDYGNAIRDLAKANIFPGDILLKNFGVTRHGRVISYDYDELCLLTDLNFRAMPPAANDDDEFAAEPWFYVGANDFFPEQFGMWLGLPEPLKSIFLKYHADLFDVTFWRDIQARIRAGEIIDILPYSSKNQLQRPGRAVETAATQGQVGLRRLEI